MSDGPMTLRSPPGRRPNWAGAPSCSSRRTPHPGVSTVSAAGDTDCAVRGTEPLPTVTVGRQLDHHLPA